MSDEFLSLTELGRLYGVSSHKMGQWLAGLGLRTADKKPSRKAFQGDFVTQRSSTQPGTYFWVWHGEMTMLELTGTGYKKAANNRTTSDSTPAR